MVGFEIGKTGGGPLIAWLLGGRGRRIFGFAHRDLLGFLFGFCGLLTSAERVEHVLPPIIKKNHPCKRGQNKSRRTTQTETKPFAVLSYTGSIVTCYGTTESYIKICEKIESEKTNIAK